MFRSACAVSLSFLLNSAPVAGLSTAQAKDGLTIGEVAKMKPRKAIAFIHNEAFLRGLDIGVLHGDAALKCIEREFVEIVPKGDGNHIFPRGLKAAIKLVHRHNNNGGAQRNAREQIWSFVDLVAQKICRVPQKFSRQ